MRLHRPGAEIFVPEGIPMEGALSRTTHMGIGAHQDDLELIAYPGILECFGSREKWFTGVTVTDGAGSPRAGLYAKYTDDEMRDIRKVEQKKAATIGEYSAQVFLDFASSDVKDSARADVVRDLAAVLEAARPEVVFTHNLADKHDTHVAVTLRVVSAIRELPETSRPRSLYGCEAWRDLDWLDDEDKILFDVAAHENLSAALLGVFDSQISGGKRYDLATMGRQRAHATFHSSHGTDETTALIYGIDLTPLIADPSLDVKEYIAGFVRRFADDVSSRIGKMI